MTAVPISPVTTVLVGNPNVGKTTLFNRLCGLRARTANYPGSTVEEHLGRSWANDGTAIDIVDLPGMYGLHLESPEARVVVRALEGDDGPAPDVVTIVLDATNLGRNLQFAATVLRRSTRAVVALNLSDEASRQGLTIDTATLGTLLRCPVVAISARTGSGCLDLVETVAGTARGPVRLRQVDGPHAPPALAEPGDRALVEWAGMVFAACGGGSTTDSSDSDTFAERLDMAFTHPIAGLAIFAIVMAGLFASIYWLAQYPMEWIDMAFGTLGGLAHELLPAGFLADLVSEGVVGGIAGTVVFLPQICLLFFLLALLEDCGYLARASFAMDRVMRRFGLPGQSFIPLLSSHACALPGIMATRLIPNTRDRLATIFVAPFLSCSARVPVYVLVISLLLADHPLWAGAAFVGCYALGATAALFTAWILGKTALPGRAAPMVLELPAYRRPDLGVAISIAASRGGIFLRQAGSIILAICIAMWWLSAFPQVGETAQVSALRLEAAALVQVDAEGAAGMEANADRLQARAQRAGSFAGQLGAVFEPAFRPLGMDREVVVAVLSSFLAREVFVSSLKVLVGAGDDSEVDESTMAMVRQSTRADGTPLLDHPSAIALLVFYVLALQCLPTLAVVRRETGSWKWPLLQFSYMSGLAWCAGALAYFIAGQF
ncbi:MAG: ferrous iron transporter B [Planctomycetota bacterium]|nr:ferrous iron transporter B [Planctomycetota bacterium]MDA1105794.1 ferrous iron transporter B [Planctomycetota bacterium]